MGLPLGASPLIRMHRGSGPGSTEYKVVAQIDLRARKAAPHTRLMWLKPRGRAYRYDGRRGANCSIGVANRGMPVDRRRMLLDQVNRQREGTDNQ